MRKIAFVLLLMVVNTGVVMAQYDFAIGLRSGGTSGITLKKNNGSTALEGIVGFWHDGVSLTGLWEKNQPAFNEPGFNWFYGLGGHVAFYGDDFDGRYGASWYTHPHHIDDGDFGIGIDGVVGLEYKIPNAPIAFDIGLKPYIEIVSEGGIIFSPDPGIGIKIAF
jgi:hypothetical protein